MRGRFAETGIVAALATITILVLAWPLLRAPSERVFGAPIVGRHHDPFTTMLGFARPIGLGPDLQPVTDLAGALIARVTGPVAAYNWLVLLTFPLTAAAAYGLARHLALGPAGAAVAALACAFSPFHLAHAAYHPHVAQVQWMPLYLLALWRCLDLATPAAIALLAAASVAVTLSNFYGGLIAIVITPAAIAAYWHWTQDDRKAPMRRLARTTAGLFVIALCGLAYASWALATARVDEPAIVADRADLIRYGARWWSYLVPPAGHPWWGPGVIRHWNRTGVTHGLLEQQVSIGWAVITLGIVAIAAWWRNRAPTAALARVPVLLVVGGVALICSLAPDRAADAWTAVLPASLLYDVVPMFRSYARFGVVVQLMAVLLAGVGVDLLWRLGTRRARLTCVALVACIAAEYAVAPAALWRDVLPTSAHRWVVQQPAVMRVVDCVAPTAESASVEWLTGGRMVTLGPIVTDCAEPNVAQRMAALGFTHLLVRRETGTPPRRDRLPAAGFQLAASFSDGQVFAVAAPASTVYTVTTIGFSPREHDREWSWQWMGAGATWIVTNTSPLLTVATLDLEVAAFAHNRQIAISLDRQQAATFTATPERRIYRLGPFTFPRGAHELGFHAVAPPTVADAVLHNRDARPLSVAIGTWTWTVAARQQP